MKKTLSITLLMLILSTICQAQITLDNVYPAASGKLYMVNLDVSGQKYIVINTVQGNRFIKLYNLNHSLWKTIDCNPFPVTALPPTPMGGPTSYQYIFDALYVSENLFDCDNDVEFMYVSSSSFKWFTGIYNEDGSPLLLADSMVPLVKANVAQQWRPLYNTPAGTRFILSHKDGSARVFKVDCSINTGLEPQMAPETVQLMDVYPNPSFYESTIRYQLPEGIDLADIVITDLAGREIKRYQVDNNFSSLLIPQSDLAAGTYIYALKAKGKVLDSKKIILLR